MAVKLGDAFVAITSKDETAKGLGSAERNTRRSLSLMERLVEGASHRMSQVVSGAFERVGHHIADSLLSIPGKLLSLPGAVLGIFGGIASGTASIMSGVVSTVASGVQSTLQTIGGLLQEGIASNIDFEQYEVRFKVLLGTAEAAQKRMKELALFGARTPFELPGVVKASAILQGFGLYAKEAAEQFKFTGEEILEIAGDVASGTGVNFEDMALYLGKFSSGATGEALARFAELGIVTRAQLKEMGLQFSKSGELLSPLPKAMETVLTLMKSKYGGLMAEQSATFGGMLSNLSDWKDGTLRTLSEPIFDSLKGQLGGLLTSLNSAELQGAINNLGAWLAGALQAPATWLLSLIQNIPNLIAILTGQQLAPQDNRTDRQLEAEDKLLTKIGTYKAKIEDLRKQISQYQLEQAQAPLVMPLFASHEFQRAKEADIAGLEQQIGEYEEEIRDLQGRIIQAGRMDASDWRTMEIESDPLNSLPPSLQGIGRGLQWLRDTLWPSVQRKWDEVVAILTSKTTKQSIEEISDFLGGVLSLLTGGQTDNAKAREFVAGLNNTAKAINSIATAIGNLSAKWDGLPQPVKDLILFVGAGGIPGALAREYLQGGSTGDNSGTIHHGEGSGLPQYHTGTEHHPGGWARVHQDETVWLPPGSRVQTAAESMAAGLTVYIGSIVAPGGPEDVRRKANIGLTAALQQAGLK